MSGLFGSIFGARAAFNAAARFHEAQMNAVAVHNQLNALKRYPYGTGYLTGLPPAPERIEPEPVGMDAVQSLAYDPERYPHCIELPAA